MGWKLPDEEILWSGQPHKWSMLWKQLTGMAGLLCAVLAGPCIYLIYGYFSGEKISVWQPFAMAAVLAVLFIISLATFKVRDTYFVITTKRVVLFKHFHRQNYTAVHLENIIGVKIAPSGFDHIYQVETISIDTGRMVNNADGEPVKDYDYIASVADAQTVLQLLKERTAAIKAML
jgi:uncharacterized membrane protein YdbT with pleckstrin-like domain